MTHARRDLLTLGLLSIFSKESAGRRKLQGALECGSEAGMAVDDEGSVIYPNRQSIRGLLSNNHVYPRRTGTWSSGTMCTCTF